MRLFCGLLLLLLLACEKKIYKKKKFKWRTTSERNQSRLPRQNEGMKTFLLCRFYFNESLKHILTLY